MKRAQSLTPKEDDYHEDISENEDDDIFKWTRALDFEKYVENWTGLATSGIETGNLTLRSIHLETNS